MSKLTKAISLAVLAFWALATVHCSLEQVPGLGFLTCCQHEGTAAHQDNDCKEDGCSVVESGFCKLDEQPAAAPIPLFTASILLPAIEPLAPTLPPGLEILTGAPPELPHTWQFSSRTALPPRAPSLVS